MDGFAVAKPEDRAAAFSETASRMGVRPAIVEKDFWVCWSLKRIFSSDQLPGILFKGGTSLSKVFALIDRFSEDVDLVIDRKELGFVGADDPTAQPSRKKRQQKVEELREKCGETIRSKILKILEEEFAAILGVDGWHLELYEDDPDQQTIAFVYPTGLGDSSYGSAQYVRAFIRLEFGCRGDLWPSEERILRPYVADHFPDLLSDPECKLQVLSPERTFWEKATLLHRIVHTQKLPPGSSRHYYDLAMMGKKGQAERALENLELLAHVVAHKKIFFEEPAANYDAAQKGTLRLSPPEEILSQLRQDYSEMEEMIFGEAPSFDSLMEEIRKMEKTFNR